jgi:hypothetical protein
MEKRSTFAATTAGKSFCPGPPAPSRRTILEGAVDKYAANEGVISAAAARVALRVMPTEGELMIAYSVCRDLGLRMVSEKKSPGQAMKYISLFAASKLT